MKNYKYFGTDGIRGKVGIHPITPDFFLKIGWASGKALSNNGSRKVIIGKDTRISGYMLESALESGLSASGLSVSLTGPMPTPAIAYLTRTFRAEAGIVVSASHNPFYDNGIKFFSTKGNKLSDKVVKSIENKLNEPLVCVESSLMGKADRIIDASGRYIEFCKRTFPSNLTLKKLKIVVDCANGATYHIAPKILQELGAKVITIGCEPNGININQQCGAIDTSLLKSKVIKEKADLGIAYDGDGDRIIMVDHLGNNVDGDQILYIITKEKLRQKKLFGGVVGTLMSNMGLEIALKKLNIPFLRSSVGDCYVIEKMQEKNWYIGAENSGHIILLDKTTTSDGIIAGLQVLSTIISNNVRLYDLCNEINLLPQVLINVNFTGNDNLLNSAIIKKTNNEIKKKLGTFGRIIIRKSGTEPLIRIMVEGKDIKQIKFFACHIANIIRSLS